MNSCTNVIECIDSILGQSFSNFEIVVQDGVSNDSTLEIVENISNQDGRIKVYSEADTGVYNAMNKAIAKARGEWIYFLGSDDALYSKTVLSEISTFISNHPTAEVIYGNVISTRFNGIYDGEFSIDKLLGKNICHQAIFFNSKVFIKLGSFDESFPILADYDFNLRWFISSKIKHFYANIIIANYADGGLSSLVKKDESFIYCIWYKIIDYALESKISDSAIALLLSTSYNFILKSRGYKIATYVYLRSYFKKPITNFLSFRSSLMHYHKL